MNQPSKTHVNQAEAQERFRSLSDEWLMKAYLDGNEACFGFLVHRYEREMFSYLRRLLGDVSLAEDVFQNTFLQVHLKRHLYEVGRPFRPWLYTIATNQSIDWLRKVQRHNRTSLDLDRDTGDADSPGSLLDMLASNAVQPVDEASDSERRELVRTIVDSLPDHLRIVIVLSYYQGMKYKEIADILEIPVGTVKSRLHAAIRRLGECWEEMGLSDDR